ncbi:MAG TPA: N-acetylmuramoyl-L-alanine amidase [Herpetosiphonaceae bacterium]
MYFATPPLAITDLPTKHTYGVLTPRLIVIHATAGTDSREWLVENPEGLSIHRLIQKDGTIYKMADDLVSCGHVGRSALWGNRWLNKIALGIELENRNNGRDPYPTAQVEACAAQVVEWLGRFGPLPVVGHYQVDTLGKTDPKGFPWWTFWECVRKRTPQAG